MTDLTWTATRTDTIDRFNGQTPRPQDEATIIDVFEQHPQLVLRAIDETAKALADGKITWAWSVLSARLERGTSALREATADTGTERNKRIQNAEHWIENAGLHYDRAKDVEGDLFGDDYQSGTLGDYRDDQALRQRLLEHWHKHRPRGERAELDSEAWNAKCKADRAIILTAKAKAAADQTGAEWTTSSTSTAAASESPGQSPSTSSASPDPATAKTSPPSDSRQTTAANDETRGPSTPATPSAPAPTSPPNQPSSEQHSDSTDEAGHDIDYTPEHAFAPSD